MKERIKIMNKYFKKSVGSDEEKALEYLNSDYEGLKERSKLLIQADDLTLSNPIVLATADVEVKGLNYRLVLNEEKEKERVDYNQAIVLTIYLGETKLFYHEAKINHINGSVLEDVSGEVAYSDVVNVETYVSGEKTRNYDTSEVDLILNLINGDDLVLTLRNHYYLNNVEELLLLTDKEQYVIKQIKSAVRTAK